MNKANFLRDREVAIIAYAEQKNERKSNKTPYDQCAGVMVKLLRQTGLKPADIDGVATMMPTAEAGNTFYSNMLCEARGLQPRWLQLSDIGGCAPMGQAAPAAAAILTGPCGMVRCRASAAHGATWAARRHSGARTQSVTPVSHAAIFLAAG